MKLENLILKESQSKINFGAISYLDEKTSEDLNKALNDFTKKYKLEYFNILNDEYATFELSHPLVAITGGLKQNSFSPVTKKVVVYLDLNINEKVLIESSSDEHPSLIFNLFSQGYEKSELDQCVQFFNIMLSETDKKISQFEDWYMDLSGKYGKLKLLGNKHRKFMAVGGYYDFGTMSTEIDSEVF